MLESRATREPDVHAHLDRDDLGEGRLTEARRAVEEHVIERVAALTGGFDKDANLVLDRGLADEVVERPGSERRVGDTLGLEFLRG